MEQQLDNCLVAQSGGPTAAINASLAGIIGECRRSGAFATVYGAINGIQGVLSRRIADTRDLLGSESGTLERLKLSPAMYLGSCRHKLGSIDQSEEYRRIFDVLAEYGIGSFFYIGGNDSMDTVAKLAAYGNAHGSPVRFIGIPKTVDNDLRETDHTPGYGSAARYIAASVLEMAYDTSIYNTQSVLIVEIMGRNAGWLTAAAALARTEYSDAPHLLYLPERSFSDKQFLDDLEQVFSVRKHVIVAVSEGIRYADGRYVSAAESVQDQFGHTMLSGAGRHLEALVAGRFGCKVRSVELNVLQRCAAHLASRTDLDEAYALGAEGVRAARAGQSGVMPCIRRVQAHGAYQVEYALTDIENVANREKLLPLHWINAAGNDVTQDFIDYACPLIQGDPAIEYRNGLPVYLPVRHLGV